MSEVKCEKCGSTEGSKSLCDFGDCACGEVKHFSCSKCGHTTPFYHITKLGKEVLSMLLDQTSNKTMEVEE